ncbi:MAG: hypothetical protein QOC71_1042 [Thermoplasmata archaeon]|nr:hypothetical protein [Thermoplasmata archaeon]
MRALCLLAVVALLAGCSDPAADPVVPTESATVITRVDDFANATAPGSHIHDYWGGKDRLTVVDLAHPGGDQPGTGPGFASGQDIVVRAFLPESGHVVPQGTGSVEVTFTWTDAQADSYTRPVLWMKTAGQNATVEVADVVSGEPVALEVGAPAADLPHQLLSAWVFELRMSSPDPMPLRFKGSVGLKVDAIRSLPLPVFPPHPDPWKGAAQLPLVDESGSLSYLEDLGDQGCDGLACPQVFRPASGQTVPTDAYMVSVKLTYSGPRDLELFYHSGLDREFARAEPVSTNGGVRTYEILVEHGGDGPYATQSQWEFTVLPPAAGPVRSTWAADYSLEAVSVK